MKVICLGGRLPGIDYVVGSAYDLRRVATTAEPLILICHGLPTEEGTDEATGEVRARVQPQLLEFNLHALVLTHGEDVPAAEHVEELRKGVAAACHRVFGLSSGWKTLERDARTRLLEFLASDEERPADAELARLLVGDALLVRLALRAALEIAREELSGPAGRGAAERPADRKLVEPARAMARRDHAAADVAQGLAKALESGTTETLRQEVERALGAVRGFD